MAPSYPNRETRSNSRMRLHTDRPTAPSAAEDSGFAHEYNVFIIGNNTFDTAVKRALNASGHFHIVGAFTMEDLETKLRRSKLLGQTPEVTVIHEPPGHRAEADDAAHNVLQTYPGSGIVLISGDELEAETERNMAVHDYNAIVLPESVIKSPKALADGIHAAISEAGSAERVA